MYGLSSFGQSTAATRPGARRGSPSPSGAVGAGRRSSAGSSCCSAPTARCWTCGPSGSRTFTAASTVLMMLMMAMLLGTIVLLPIYMQNVLGLSPLTTGLLLLPGGLLMGLLGPVVGRLYDRFGARALLVPGHRRRPARRCGRRRCSASHARLAQILGVPPAAQRRAWRSCSPRCSPPGSGAVAPHLYAYGSAIFGTTQQLAGAAGRRAAGQRAQRAVGGAGAAAGASVVGADGGRGARRVPGRRRPLPGRDRRRLLRRRPRRPGHGTGHGTGHRNRPRNRSQARSDGPSGRRRRPREAPAEPARRPWPWPWPWPCPGPSTRP